MSQATAPPHVAGFRDMLSGGFYGPPDMHRAPAHREGAGVLDVVYDYDAIAGSIGRDALASSGETGMWRYRALLPLSAGAAVPPLPVGGTPLCALERMAAPLGLCNLWVKDEGRQPSGSLKDRASALAVAMALAEGAPAVATASTGNAAAALAGLSASVGIPCVIFVPATAPEAKVAQLLAYGAEVFLVEGTYDDAFELCQQACAVRGWYNRNTGYNPFMAEGKKTAAYEICEALGWSVPDCVFVGVGDGCIVGGLHKGFRDLLALGWIDRMPRLMGVQATGSDYLHQAWRDGTDILRKPAIAAHTRADSLHAGLPRDRVRALKAIADTGGGFLRVDDEAILAAIPALAQGGGVFAEPAGAAAYAGLLAALASGMVESGERVVLVNTGNGLKDVRSALSAVEKAGRRPVRVTPDAAALPRFLSESSSGRKLPDACKFRLT